MIPARRRRLPDDLHRMPDERWTAAAAGDHGSSGHSIPRRAERVQLRNLELAAGGASAVGGGARRAAGRAAAEDVEGAVERGGRVAEEAAGGR